MIGPLFTIITMAASRPVSKNRPLELTALISSAVGRSKLNMSRAGGRKKAYDIRDYIEANLSEKLSLDLIACKNGLSVRALTAVFKTEFEESIGQYLTRRRMDCALVMLSEGASVNQTAYALGYQATSFSTAFARHFGYSPSCLLTK
jgi:AraC-like DNA-binding protein